MGAIAHDVLSLASVIPVRIVLPTCQPELILVVATRGAPRVPLIASTHAVCRALSVMGLDDTLRLVPALDA